MITVPAYNSYIFRARQAEAKIGLSVAFAAEKGHVAEFNSYTSCLGMIMDAPTGSSHYYNVGFNAMFNGVGTCVSNPGTSRCNEWPVGSATICAIDPVDTAFPYAFRATTLAYPTAYNQVGADLLFSAGPGTPVLSHAMVSSTTFVLEAAGSINPSSSNVDHWTLDNENNLVHY